MGKSKIEWCDKVWNPITGCSPVSAGCEHCYAKRMAYRLKGRYGYPKDDPFRVTFHPDRLEEPTHWKKPSRIFVCSMGDLFHGDVANEFLNDIFSVMQDTGRHTFSVLTKRPLRMKRFLNLHWPVLNGNIMPGVSVENQKTYDERASILSKIECAYRFISFEPLLSPVIGEFLDWRCDWVICGGETGPKARPLHPDWVRGLRDQCQNARVPFFFKSWGEWMPRSHWRKPHPKIPWGTLDIKGNWYPNTTLWNWHDDDYECPECETIMLRVGHKHSGRLLDGREWNEILI